MLEWIATHLINSGTKCWTCFVFDNMFAIISDTAAAVYERLTTIGFIVFCILFAFYVISAVWKNIENGGKDPFFEKSIRPVLIKSLFALSLLMMGLTIPRIISQITFEPVSLVALHFSNAMLPPDYVVPHEYVAIPLSENGFFSPELRDTILQLIESSVSNFQKYILLGISVVDDAFSIASLISIGSLIRHILVFFIGLFLTYNFVKLFIKYSFCFIDIIVAMALFAFFFPISLVLFIFKDAKDLPEWMKKLGGNLGAGQIKKLINAIVSVAATILTYTIIMQIIEGYLNLDTLPESTSSLFNFDLENSEAMQLTFVGAIVLVYVIQYIADQIPKITAKIMSIFGLSQEDSLSKGMGEDTLKIAGLIAGEAKQLAKSIVTPDKVIADSSAKTNTNPGDKTKDTKNV